MQRFAEIAIPIPLGGTFYYSIGSEPAVEPGCAVQVPFGARVTTGYVVSVCGREEVEAEVPLAKIRRVIGSHPHNPGVPKKMVELARWIAAEYIAGLGESIETMIPAAVRHGRGCRHETWVTPAVSRHRLLEEIPALLKRAPKQSAVLELMSESLDEALVLSVVQRESGAGKSSIMALVDKGLLKTFRRQDEDPAMPAAASHAPVPTLTDEQEGALKAVLAARGKAKPVVLLEGITGSGKTEVYIRAAEGMLNDNRQSIIIVPEISLTPQTIERFRARFRRVAVLHSQLTDGQRAEQYKAIRDGRADIVVGARSAVFAPVPRLGLVAIDEEHETSYKEDTSPRYHARDVAIKRAQLEKGTVILGSATPALESISASLAGEYGYARLTKRPTGGNLPHVEIVDMREEVAARKKYVFVSRRLSAAVTDTLAGGKQVLLLLNRRGFSTQLYCPQCGNVVLCEHCDIPMTYHRSTSKLLCHYCEHTVPPPNRCPTCGGDRLLYLGTGTERLEEEIRSAAPNATLARLDSDIMKKRGAYFDILSAFRSGDIQILVGTQIIAKGLDIPGVSLVGVINADSALNMADFRAGERTAQLLCQVAGRAGRINREGRVIIQSTNAPSAAITSAVGHRYHEYALAELENRRKWKYPPATKLARIVSTGDTGQAAKAALTRLKRFLVDKAGSLFASPDVGILGPAPCVRDKVRNKHRYHMLLRCEQAGTLQKALYSLVPLLKKGRETHLTVDVDPYNML